MVHAVDQVYIAIHLSHIVMGQSHPATDFAQAVKRVVRIQEVDGAVVGVPKERRRRGKVYGAGEIVGKAYLAGAGVQGFPKEASPCFICGAKTVGRARVEGYWDVSGQTRILRDSYMIGYANGSSQGYVSNQDEVDGNGDY